MNLKQTIRRILMEDYSPAGEEIIPNKIVVHKSNPMFRHSILEEGLKVRVGECYQIYVNREQRDPDKIKCKPVIFATNSTNKRNWFDSTYDDDVWMINTKCAGVNWYKDKHYDNDYHIVTFEDISPDCLKLIYKGTGKSEDMLQESIRKVLKEQTQSVNCDCGWSWKLSEGGDDPYICHKCGKDNSKKEQQTNLYDNLKTVAFRDLPFEYQRSLIIYMYEGPVVDWSLDLDRDEIAKDDNLVKILINDYMSFKRNKNKSFAYGVVPMNLLTKEIAERMGYDTFDEYHKDYVGSNYVQKHKNSVWPIILNFDNDELIEDGWHRFHDYYSRGLNKVPVVMFI